MAVIVVVAAPSTGGLLGVAAAGTGLLSLAVLLLSGCMEHKPKVPSTPEQKRAFKERMDKIIEIEMENYKKSFENDGAVDAKKWRKRRSTDAERIETELKPAVISPLVLISTHGDMDKPKLLAYPFDNSYIPITVKMGPDINWRQHLDSKRVPPMVPKLQKVPKGTKRLKGAAKKRRTEADHNSAAEGTMWGVPPVPELER